MKNKSNESYSNFDSYLLQSDYEIAQKHVISACLLNGLDFFYTYCIDINSNHFQNEHIDIWNAIIELANEFEPNVNMISVSKILRKNGIKTPAKILNEVTKFISYNLSENLYFVNRLIELNLRENAYYTCLQSMQDSLNETKEITQTIQETHDKLDSENTNLENVTLDFLPDFTDDLLNNNEVLYKSYITPIDKITNGGFAKKDLIVIGARPGMGKTEIALHIAYENAKNGIPILYISLEMGKEQLAKRLITKILNSEFEYSFDNKRLKDKKLNEIDKEQIRHASKLLKTMPIYILDSADLKCENMLMKITALKRRHKIELAILDHLHLVSHENTRLLGEEAVGRVSRECKKVAKALDIPFIALCQLRREVENRANKRPNNSDLRQSGQIEQDADCTIFLYRDDYYQMQESENYIPNNEIEYIFGKNRGGSVQTGYGLIYLDKNTLKDIENNL